LPEPSTLYEGEIEPAFQRPARPQGLESGFLRAFGAFDDVVTRWVERLARWADARSRPSAPRPTPVKAPWAGPEPPAPEPPARGGNEAPAAHSPLALGGPPLPPWSSRRKAAPEPVPVLREVPARPPAEPEIQVLADAPAGSGGYVRERSPTGEGLRIL